jgi:AhpD family alkylhydroperoxidase
MGQRIDFLRASPRGAQALGGLQNFVNSSGLEHSLLELVKMRASQINGCAFCLDMHSKDARAAGESEQRLYLLNAWEETKLYSARERAALAWAESLTLVSENHVPDSVYAQAREQFSEEELVNLSLAVVAINSWNRLVIAFRREAGSYQPGDATRLLKPAAAAS